MSRVAWTSTELWLVETDRTSLPDLIAPLVADRTSVGTTGKLDIARIIGRNPEDDLPRTIAHLALRLILARQTGVAAALEPFTRSALGKPSLGGSAPAFSLSHSGTRALIAISRVGEIGCDIEAPRTPRLPAGKQAMILAAAADISGKPLPTSSSEKAFLQAWVRLEAAAKASGEGMGRLLTRYGVFGTDEDRARLRVSGDRWQATAFRVRDLDLDQGYAAAVAATVATAPADVQTFPTNAFDIGRFLVS